MPGENGSENVGQKHGAETWGRNRGQRQGVKTRGKDKGQRQGAETRGKQQITFVPTGIEPQYNRRKIFKVNCLERHILYWPPIGLTGYALRIKQEFLLKLLYTIQIKLIGRLYSIDVETNRENNQFF